MGLLSAPSGTAPVVGSPRPALGASAASLTTDPAPSAHLRVALSHRFTSGRIEVRLDGSKALEDPLKGTGTRTRFVRTLPVAPGSHRIEIRVVSGKTFDDVEGIQGSFRPKEEKELAVTISSITKRLKMRFEDAPSGGDK